jgi:Tol biopolymer transport system component
MLTGQSAFPGETVSDTLAAVLQREPRWDLLSSDTPDEIRRLLRRCLEKDAKRRLHDIADARLEVEDARSRTRDDAIPPAPPRSPLRRASLWAAALLGLFAAASAGWFLRPAPAAPELRFELNTPPTADASVAISPDGLKVVFVGTSGRQSQLWLRSLDASSARPLAGTERASTPFWSPDSRSIGFFADGLLRRMDIDGRSVRTLSSESAVPIGGTWNRDDIILFADNPGGPIFRISADGGERSTVTRVGVPQQRGHHFPQFLPDGRHFLFFVTGSPEARGVYIGQLDTPDTKRLFDAEVPAAFAAPGHLLFLRENKLFAQRFDPALGELSGDPFAVQEPVPTGTTLSASAGGPIVYRTRPGSSSQRQFVRVDRTGREIERVVYPDGAALGPALSHDGRRVAVYRFANGNMDIWSYEVHRRVWDRITFNSGDDIYPLWSPDDSSIIFAGMRAGRLDLFLKRLGTPPDVEEVVLSTFEGKFPMDWSADGRFLLYSSGSAKQGRDIWALSLQGERKPFEVVRTDFNETQAQFSPDGTWIAYQSDKSGRDEVYLRPFPGPGSDVAVSTEGGSQVRWNGNGKELFYVATDDRLVAVPVDFSPDNKTVAPGKPAGLFATNVGSAATLKYRQQYVVAMDGRSFVMNSAVEEGSASPITVILNWKPDR